jgi:DNA-binding beta-propeller fold protein YncE
VVTDNRILRYDLLERRVAADVPLPSRGKLAISPDGRALYLTDHGDGRNYSGSGYLYVFDADLRPRAPIDLREVANTGGQYIQTNAAAVSADGTRVYVAAGSASRGPLFTAQPGRVLVVDAGTGKILKEVPVEGWLTRDIFVR